MAAGVVIPLIQLLALLLTAAATWTVGKLRPGGSAARVPGCYDEILSLHIIARHYALLQEMEIDRI
jgi:hypothetical protein